MILEAFSQVLHLEREQTGDPAVDILHRWLHRILTQRETSDNTTKVIHMEIAMIAQHGQIAFLGRSPSGERLLNSLYIYCESYENWQFSRWLHDLKPHAFNDSSGF